MKSRYFLTAIALIALAAPAQARQVKIAPILDIAAQPAYPSGQRASPVRYSAVRGAGVAGGSETLLPHPAGCPRIAFCACGASVEVFGHSVRDLWPASAWFRFPRTSPAPGMVGVRSHHVFVLRSPLNGSVWLIADYNSGGHRSRLHARDISGYKIVDPHGSRVASR